MGSRDEDLGFKDLGFRERVSDLGLGFVKQKGKAMWQFILPHDQEDAEGTNLPSTYELLNKHFFYSGAGGGHIVARFTWRQPATTSKNHPP